MSTWISLSESASKPARIDGRRLRSARTKQLIIEAYLTLLRESPQIPTAATIAERAGYSVRSVFERFPDLHALRVAATDYAFTQGTAQAVARAERQPGRFERAQVQDPSDTPGDPQAHRADVRA